MHAALMLTDNNIVATNGTVLFILSLLLFLKCLFFVAPIYAPAYPFQVVHTQQLFRLPVVPLAILSGSTLHSWVEPNLHRKAEGWVPLVYPIKISILNRE